MAPHYICANAQRKQNVLLLAMFRLWNNYTIDAQSINQESTISTSNASQFTIDRSIDQHNLNSVTLVKLALLVFCLPLHGFNPTSTTCIAGFPSIDESETPFRRCIKIAHRSTTTRLLDYSVYSV